jgi:hypothetical protein
VRRESNGYETILFLAFFIAVDAMDLDLVTPVTLLPVTVMIF